jgi:hypothetical protein
MLLPVGHWLLPSNTGTPSLEYTIVENGGISTSWLLTSGWLLTVGKDMATGSLAMPPVLPSHERVAVHK